MPIGNNAISASTRMATTPWLTDRSSAACGRARSTTSYKGLFTLRTLTDVGVPKGRTSTSVTALQRASTSVDVRERTSTSVDTRHRTLTDTYNICKCYTLMLMIFSIILYVIKMQIKHVIISNLITGCYYWGNVRWRALSHVNVRHGAL